MGAKQMTFRLDEDLILLAKEKAKAQNRSLNNYIEFLLFREVGNVPNKETIKAIEDARKGVGLERMDDIEGFFESIRNQLTES